MAAGDEDGDKPKEYFPFNKDKPEFAEGFTVEDEIVFEHLANHPEDIDKLLESGLFGMLGAQRKMFLSLPLEAWLDQVRTTDKPFDFNDAVNALLFYKHHDTFGECSRTATDISRPLLVRLEACQRMTTTLSEFATDFDLTAIANVWLQALKEANNPNLVNTACARLIFLEFPAIITEMISVVQDTDRPLSVRVNIGQQVSIRFEDQLSSEEKNIVGKLWKEVINNTDDPALLNTASMRLNQIDSHSLRSELGNAIGNDERPTDVRIQAGYRLGSLFRENLTEQEQAALNSLWLFVISNSDNTNEQNSAKSKLLLSFRNALDKGNVGTIDLLNPAQRNREDDDLGPTSKR